MDFNPISFIIVSLLLYCLFILTSIKTRTYALLFASIGFLLYFNQSIAFYFIALSLINYFSMKMLNSANIKTTALLVLLNIASLVFLKYICSSFINFIALGISFFCFQQVALIIDRHNQSRPLPSLDLYLASSLYFSNLYTGPVMDLSDNFENKKNLLYLNSKNLEKSIILFLLGCFKIYILSDNISPLTELMFINSLNSGFNLLIPFLLNKYEIYVNFSGYTDISIGCALLLGINLPPNFNRPFATTSIIEFWKRWHMSLTSWIKKYLFYPLALSPIGKIGIFPITILTFLVLGLWHNVKFTFVWYAIIQAILVFGSSKMSFISNAISKINSSPAKFIFTSIKWLWFYIFLLSIPAVIFKANDMDQAFLIFKNIISMPLASVLDFSKFTTASLFQIIISVAILEIIERFNLTEIAWAKIEKWNVSWKFAALALIVLALIYYSNPHTSSSFVYSNF